MCLFVRTVVNRSNLIAFAAVVASIMDVLLLNLRMQRQPNSLSVMNSYLTMPTVMAWLAQVSVRFRIEIMTMDDIHRTMGLQCA
jgi:hypothetical protein